MYRDDSKSQDSVILCIWKLYIYCCQSCLLQKMQSHITAVTPSTKILILAIQVYHNHGQQLTATHSLRSWRFSTLLHFQRLTAFSAVYCVLSRHLITGNQVIYIYIFTQLDADAVNTQLDAAAVRRSQHAARRSCIQTQSTRS